jgi:hypothetical protein
VGFPTIRSSAYASPLGLRLPTRRPEGDLAPGIRRQAMMGTMERLRAGLAHLTARDREFAESLLSQAGGRGLSAKQSAWIDRLAARAAPPDPTEKPIVVAPIVAMFAKAYGTLKLPKVLVDADGTSLRLTVAGGRSRAPGSIVVTSAARSYDDRAFYGRIMQDGTVRFGCDVGSDVKRTIGAALLSHPLIFSLVISMQ